MSSSKQSDNNTIETRQYEIDDSITCLQFDLISNIQRKEKQIVIALDVSGSMRGQGIDQAKIAISNLFEQVVDTPDVVLITYDTSAELYDLRKKPAETRQSTLEQIQAGGGTDFTCVFEAISNLDMFNRQSEVAILFFTDGQDGSSHKREKAIEQMKKVLETKTQSFEFHTIGFTSSHDVALLTQITQLGSVQGTFQYVKDANEINQSMENLIGLLTSNSSVGILLGQLATGLVSKLDESFRSNILPFIKVASEYLNEKEDISDIHSMVNSKSGLICLLIQTVNFQTPNKKKVAIEKGEYYSPFNEEESIKFMKSITQLIISKKISISINHLINNSASYETANLFIQSEDEIEAAGILHGNLKGSVPFHNLVNSFQSSKNIPLVKEKVKMLITGYYKHVRLTLDKDGAEWNARNRFCFRVWKNNRSAFESKEEVISLFGEKYRDYLVTVMRIFKN
ncbi:predicted protein [Naegleria gruberi]|uniref:Predicted protein n=1 Tax=Naegleria gruberi TaxID=5762 RepID=D2W4Q3_NAEGR|nr:uncharacterized protein NAEGRDRAFT_76388 [Naegleria gruberi]EFC35949.1 predicted protein [Naegleria gruberi]|eukprot:XP_002668693.1 predicted protein [Naegleria gruberi strain NEG-M]